MKNNRNYTSIQIRLPTQVANKLLNWVENSNMKKADFLRLALMSGASNLAEILDLQENAKKNNQQNF